MTVISEFAQQFSRGFHLQTIDLPTQVRALVEARDWEGLDRAMRKETLPGGIVFEALRPYASFTEIEFIISIRSSREYADEDGIWHDDGSRVLAFSLSLTLAPEAIEGGRLAVRKRGAGLPEEVDATTPVIPTPPYGTLIVFATGVDGFEHKIHRVIAGERLIIAGWCT